MTAKKCDLCRKPCHPFQRFCGAACSERWEFGERPPKKPRGFAALPPERLREIASKGGRSSVLQGKAHTFTREEAVAAGRKGGAASQAKRRSAKTAACSLCRTPCLPSERYCSLACKEADFPTPQAKEEGDGSPQ